MKITPIDPQLDFAFSDLERSPGLHASGIYGDLYQDLEPTRFVRGSMPDPLRLGLGMAFEERLEAALLRAGHEVVRPGEFFTEEGIAFSPDLLIFDSPKGAVRVGEIKLTWMTSRDLPAMGDTSHTSLPDKMSKYAVQLMFYCRNIGVSLGRYYILCVNGNGKGRRDPELHTFDVEFSERELESNHRMLLNHAKDKGMLYGD